MVEGKFVGGRLVEKRAKLANDRLVGGKLVEKKMKSVKNKPNLRVKLA